MIDAKLSRHWRIGLGAAAAALGLLACLSVALVTLSLSPPPSVRQPYPNAILVSEASQPQPPRRWVVTRQYQAVAQYRDVVNWYQGKDSLLPLPPILRQGCFHQSYMRGVVEEAVTVCSSARGTTITSVTTASFQLSLLRVYFK